MEKVVMVVYSKLMNEKTSKILVAVLSHWE